MSILATVQQAMLQWSRVRENAERRLGATRAQVKALLQWSRVRENAERNEIEPTTREFLQEASMEPRS